MTTRRILSSLRDASRPALCALALAALFLGAGCKKKTYHELTDEDLAWIIYGNKDTVGFVSNAGQRMTFEAYNRMQYYVEEGSGLFERSSVDLRLKNTTLPDIGYLAVERVAGGTAAKLRWPHFNGIVDLVNAPVVTDTLYGVIYTDLCVVQAPSTSQTLFIQTIYYSKSAGMVRFVDRYTYSWKNLNI
jgi:hypothetical protein